jgi:DNA adenine methylase
MGEKLIRRAGVMKLITNVTSVHMRSPFRYPGGKTWLVPLICQWLDSLRQKPSEFIEPFAGGGTVGLNVLFSRLSDHITLVELDENVAAVWKTLIYGDAHRFADRIATFELTPESAKRVLSQSPQDIEEKAFQTIVRNRVNRAGILASNAGMLRYGENGKGIRSRWYPETLRKRILEIAQVRRHITFLEGDGLEVLRQNSRRADVVFFIDPPYSAGGKCAGERLYSHHQLDHEELFGVTSTLTGDFLMTYSNDDTVLGLARQHNMETKTVSMKSSHHAKITELLIGRDLNWLR